MTKEELKEAIAATITENGQKGITGQALANLLNEIVDAAGEGGGGGDILCLDLKNDAETFEPILTPSEENLQFRQTLIEGLTNNKHYIVFLRNTMSMSGDLGGGVTGNVYMVDSMVAAYQYINAPDAGVDELVLAFDTNYNGTITTSNIIINSDGSLTIPEQ
jgi:hypothetical protein